MRRMTLNRQTLVFEGSRVETLKIDDVSLRVKALHGPENRIPLRLRTFVMERCAHGQGAGGVACVHEIGLRCRNVGRGTAAPCRLSCQKR